MSCAEAYGWTLDQALAVTPGQANAVTAAAERLRWRRTKQERRGGDLSDVGFDEDDSDG